MIVRVVKYSDGDEKKRRTEATGTGKVRHNPGGSLQVIMA